MTPEPAPVTRARGARARERRAVVARVLGGAAVLAVTGAVLAAGTMTPVSPTTSVAPIQVDVPAPVTGLVCPGPLRLGTEPEPGEDVAYDPQFDPSPGASEARLRALTAGTDGPDEAEVSDGSDSSDRSDGGSGPDDAARGVLHPLGVPDEVLATLEPVAGAAAASLNGLEGSVVVRADPAGDRPAWAAGAVTVRTAGGDLRGIVAASCQEPSPETWLVGGSTELGSSARLVLQNPGRTAATVQVELWGPAGPVELAGAAEYLVPAGSERVVLLEGVAAEQRRIVVRLAAAGGLVAAHLQDSQLRGLVPAGVDFVVAGRPPATRQVLPGLSVTETETAGADTSALRILAPGDAGGTARISFLGPQGQVVLPGTERVDLEAGAVLDVPLGGLPSGDYTAVVTADVPVVAGALVTRGAGVGLPDQGTLGTSPLERAWVPSVVPGPGGPLALPEGATGRLVVAAVPDQPGEAAASAGGTAAVTLEVVGAVGGVLAERQLRVPPGTTVSLALDELVPPAVGEVDADDAEGEPAAAGASEPGGVVLRSADARIVWAVVLLSRGEGAGELVSVLAPVPAPSAKGQTSVRLR